MIRARGNIKKGLESMKTEEMLTGVNNSQLINIYSEPDLNSEIVCKVQRSAEVLIDLVSSTKDFYKVYTAIGAEGFCQKDLIKVK